MTVDRVLLVLLALVDVAALTIGLSIRRKVTKIVGDTAGQIEAHVRAGIAEAVRTVAGIAVRIFQAQGRDELAQELGAELLAPDEERRAG